MSGKASIGDWLFRSLVLLGVVLYAALIVDLFVTRRIPYIPTIAPFGIRIVLGLLGAGSGLAVSSLVIWRVPGNAVGRLLLLWTFSGIGFQFSFNINRPDTESALFLIFIFYFSAVALSSFVLLLFYFPSGEVFPPRLRTFVSIFVIVRLVGSFLVVLGTDSTTFNLSVNPWFVPELSPFRDLLVLTIGYIGGLSLVIGVLVGTYSLVLRYRNAVPEEQQQIKWFVWAGMVLAMVLLLFTATHLIVSDDFAKLHPATDFPIFVLLGILPPAAIGAAILRYRLWDIDFLINRTLVYGIVSSTLAAVYFTSVLGFQEVLGNITGERSPIAVVASTLIIAALFQPIRRGVQAFIDRRFNRERYDSHQLLERFGTEVGNEVESDSVAYLLLEAVDDSLQPRHSSVWVRRQE